MFPNVVHLLSILEEKQHIFVVKPAKLGIKLYMFRVTTHLKFLNFLNILKNLKLSLFLDESLEKNLWFPEFLNLSLFCGKILKKSLFFH